MWNEVVKHGTEIVIGAAVILGIIVLGFIRGLRNSNEIVVQETIDTGAI